MNKRDIMLINDILESINRIDVYTDGVVYDSFLHNQMLIDAVIRNLEIIGEAARNVSDEIRNKYTEIPWKNMIGLRNILIHQYFSDRAKESQPFVLFRAMELVTLVYNKFENFSMM